MLAPVPVGIREDRRDDPRRVTAQFRHVSERHLSRVIPKLAAHQLGLAPGHRDKNGLTARQARPDKAAEHRQVLTAALIEQCQVTESAVGGCGDSHLTLMHIEA